MVEFSQRLKQARAAKNLSQRQAAALIGINQSTFSAYESSGKLPSIDIAHRIAKNLGVSLEWLAGGDDGIPLYTYGDVVRTLKSLEDVSDCFIDAREKEVTFTFYDEILVEYYKKAQEFASVYKADPKKYELYSAWEDAAIERLDQKGTIALIRQIEHEEAEEQRRLEDELRAANHEKY